MGYQDSDLAVYGQTLIIYLTPSKLFPNVCTETSSLKGVRQSRMKPGVSLVLFFFFFFLFIYFWLHWVFVAACELSLIAASGGYSLLWCVGFSLQWLLLLRSMGSKLSGSVAVARGLSSCGMWSQ